MAKQEMILEMRVPGATSKARQRIERYSSLRQLKAATRSAMESYKQTKNKLEAVAGDPEIASREFDVASQNLQCALWSCALYVMHRTEPPKNNCNHQLTIRK